MPSNFGHRSRAVGLKSSATAVDLRPSVQHCIKTILSEDLIDI